MPIYAFSCDACGHEFDRLQKLSDPDPEACPACAAAAVKRQVTAPSFLLEGGDWYEPDVETDGKRNIAGGDAKPADTNPAESKRTGKKAEAQATPSSTGEAERERRFPWPTTQNALRGGQG